MLGFLAFATSKLPLTKFLFRKRIENAELNQRCENLKKSAFFREIDVEFSMPFDFA